MRLLYLSADPGVPVLGHKGASVHLREMVTALDAAGAEVAIASPRINPEGDVLEASVDLVAIDQILPGEFATVEGLRAATEEQAEQVTAVARDLAVEAIYERFSLFSDAGVRTAKALALPHVLEVNAPLREEAARFRSLPHPELAAEIETEVYTGADRIFAVSANLAARLVADGADVSKVEITPNAVAATRFSRRRPFGGRPFTVGFAGSLKAWHGLEFLLAAVEAALDGGSDLLLEVVGTGPLEPMLDESSLPEGRLVHHGALPHSETTRLMSGWDVGVAPYPPLSDFYFSPMKVLEYMAAGACPVASDVGDISHLLGAGRRGVLVPPGDANALAAALGDLANDRERARRLGRRARDYVRSHHRWADNADRVLEALSLAGRAVAA